MIPVRDEELNPLLPPEHTNLPSRPCAYGIISARPLQEDVCADPLGELRKVLLPLLVIRPGVPSVGIVRKPKLASEDAALLDGALIIRVCARNAGRRREIDNVTFH
jgi:hypothetical protein